MCVGILVLVVPRKLVNPGIVFAFLGCAAIKIYDKFDLDLSQVSNTATGGRANGKVDGGIFTLLEPLARLGGFFFAGAVLYIYRDKIKLSLTAVVACVAVCVGLATIGWFHTLAPIFWAYALMYVATSRRGGRINFPNDLSYGTYIYAFPITQIWAIVNVDHPMPYVVFAFLCVATTMPIAWLSWHYLEKPAMSLKRLTAGRDKAIIGVP
jgi:peptidoglycan/LPS O-acetylase OafA/YrhL